MFADDYFRPSNSAEIAAETPELIVEGTRLHVQSEQARIVAGLSV